MTCRVCQHQAKKFRTYGKRRIQRYRCTSCHATFSESGSKVGTHYTNPELAEKALSMMLEGMSVRALNPDLILMDEPTEGLAPVTVKHVEEAVQTMRAEGISILLVEQNLHSALAVADLVHILEVGSIVFSGLPQELAANQAILHRHLGV